MMATLRRQGRARLQHGRRGTGRGASSLQRIIYAALRTQGGGVPGARVCARWGRNGAARRR
jgi:hypothetical protein